MKKTHRQTGKGKRTAGRLKDAPLKYEVTEDGLLTITIGIRTLSWAAEHTDDWNPFDDGMNDFRQAWRVVDDRQFANDIIVELSAEDEVRGTPFTYLLDKAANLAIGNGDCSVEECPPGTPSAWVQDDRRERRAGLKGRIK